MTANTLRCPGCRRRVRVPAGTDPGRSRCSKCRTRLRAAADDDAYHVFAATVADDPPPADEPLSLDECEPIATVGAATVELPPPFKVRAVATGTHPLRGAVAAVFTPFGLFAEREANRPLLFAPVGTVAVAAGRTLRLTLPGGQLALALPSPKLVADAAAFLAGSRPVPAPADYRRPGRLLPATLLPLVVLVALAGAAFAGGAALYLALRPPPPPVELPPEPPPIELPPEPPPIELPPEHTDPPTHYDLMMREGTARLPDGPAAVTALGVTPDGSETVVGYADGATWAWRLDQPAFEPPRVGPRGVGPVRRITFAPAGDVVYLGSDTGLSVAKFHAPRVTLHVPGAHAAAFPEPNRERFGAVRDGKLVLRYVPTALAKEPPPGRVKNGVITASPKDETQPANTRQDVPAPGVTFVGWHPAGRLLYGTADGTVFAYPTALKATPATRLHGAPVRAWAVGPVWADFATGDDNGVVGVWPEGASAPYPLRAGAVAVRHLAFNPCGGELAVADDAGAISVWNLPTRAKSFAAFRLGARVIAYAPRADVLLVADGAGVELWWLPALVTAWP